MQNCSHQNLVELPIRFKNHLGNLTPTLLVSFAYRESTLLSIQVENKHLLMGNNIHLKENNFSSSSVEEC